MTVRIDFGSTTFRTAFGSTPYWHRKGSAEREENRALRRITHTITLRGTIVAAAGTAAQMQQSLNERRKAFRALMEGGPQVFKIFDSDGTTLSLQYGGTDPGVTHCDWVETFDGLGLHVVDWDFDDQRADTLHVNYQDYSVTLQAETESECDEDGVQSVHWRETRSYRNFVIESAAYSGHVITCVGTECETVVDDLIADLQVMAEALFAVDGAALGEIRHTITAIKDMPGRCEFTITFGTGASTAGTSADAIKASANFQVSGNRWELRVTGEYLYSRSRRRTVLEEARRLQGIDIDDYIPTGGTPVLHRETQIAYNDHARTITATQLIVGIWKHNDVIISLKESISISRAKPKVTDRAHGWMLGDTEPPVGALFVGGLGPITITITTEIEATSPFIEIPDRFTADYDNGPVPAANHDVGWDSLEADVEGQLTQKGLYKSRKSEVWKHADPATLPLPIPISSLFGQATKPLPEAS